MLRRVSITLTFILLICMASCIGEPPDFDSGITTTGINHPNVAKGKSGEAIVVYEANKGGSEREAYAQKISPAGHLLWEDKGILVGSGYWQGWVSRSSILSDGHGGAIIQWTAYPSKPDWETAPGERSVQPKYYITRVASEGSILWGKEFDEKYPVSMVTDGTGGAIILFMQNHEDTKEDVPLLIKIDGDGSFPWGEEGIPLQGYGRRSQMISAEDGGVILMRRGTQDHLFAQKVSSSGHVMWKKGGKQISNIRSDTDLYAMTGDGGGAIIVWSSTKEGEGNEGNGSGLYGQRIDAEGNILWGSEGVCICARHVEVETGVPGLTTPTQLSIVKDGQNGAIVTWEDHRYVEPFCIYGQRLDADGNILWDRNGTHICRINSPGSLDTRMVGNSSGGAILVVWYPSSGHEGRLLAQKIGSQGQTMWPEKCMVTSLTDYCCEPAISSDSHGGVLVTWKVGRRGDTSYVQRINSEGERLWGDEGIPLPP